jgi:hypothetical protein
MRLTVPPGRFGVSSASFNLRDSNSAGVKPPFRPLPFPQCHVIACRQTSSYQVVPTECAG